MSLAKAVPKSSAPSARHAKSASSTANPASLAPVKARWGYEVQNKEEQSALKRLAILRTAAQLFNTRGFYATSLNDLATSLHVTKPSLYYYVKSKEDILLQILHHAMGLIDPAIAQAEATGRDGLHKVELFVQQYADILVGDFGKCLVRSGTTPLEQAARDQLAPSFRRIDRAVRKMVTEGITDGSIAPCDPKLAAFSLFGALHWMTSWYRADGALSAQALTAAMFEIFRNGLAGPGEARGKAAAPPARRMKRPAQRAAAP